jgi:hypothetical protein
VEAIVYYLGVATSAGAVWGKSLKSPFKYHHCCCVMLLKILKMDQIDLFVGGRPWLALASGYLEQKDCLYIGSAKFCPGGHFGDNFHATSAGARKIKEEHHVTDGTWSNLGIAAVPGLRDIKMPQVALTLKLQEVPGNSGRLEMLNLLTL